MSSARAKRQGAGQPPTDIVWRLRNWAWYNEVKAATRLSDEALDVKYLGIQAGGGLRPRLFQRIRSVGSNPAQPRLDLANHSVFDRVHAKSSPPADAAAPLDRAAQNFGSVLWRMLTEPGYARSNFTSIIDELIAAGGWYRATPEDWFLAQTFFPDDIAFGVRGDQENVYSTMLTSLESTPCADHIALLGALFCEAMFHVDLERAALLRSSLMLCTTLWMDEIGWRDTNDPRCPDRSNSIWLLHGEVFEHLVYERLIRNAWAEPAIDRRQCGNQRKFVKALLAAHRRPGQAPPSPTIHSIVLRSPRIEWLVQNRRILEEVARELVEAEHVAQLRESENRKVEKYGRRWAEYANTVRAKIRPPERDTRYCLPVLPNSGARNGSRAAPYLADGTLEKVAP